MDIEVIETGMKLLIYQITSDCYSSLEFLLKTDAQLHSTQDDNCSNLALESKILRRVIQAYQG